jgi:hypothetical protein
MLLVRPIIASGDSIIPLLVIIFAIIAQIVKFSKKNVKTGQPQSAQPQDDKTVYTAPDDELKKFLQSLSGTASGQQPFKTQEEAPPPAPSPEKVVVVKTRKTALTWDDLLKPAQPVIQNVPLPPPVPVEPQPYEVAPPSPPAYSPPEPAAAAPKAATAAPAAVMRPAARSRIRAAVTAELSGLQSIRKLIILREILGPPIGLRRNGMYDSQALPM